jgi:hypothetical protein
MRNPGNIAKNKGCEALIALLKLSTQTELSARTGIRQSALSDIVTLHKKPNVREVVALAKEGIAPEWWTIPIVQASSRAKGAA